MLSERFLGRLEDAFPHFYDRVNADAIEDAMRLRSEAGGDLERALVRARFEGARAIWWPYVRGTVPLARDELPAMEAFTRLVLTVFHLVGQPPATMEAARGRVVAVLRDSLDVERLQRMLRREEKEAAKDAAKGAAAGAGVVASMTALVAPLQSLRAARKWVRFVPPPLRATLAAVVVAALLSIPLVAGYSAGQHAEAEARKGKDTPAVKGQDPRISV
ncbi:MAG TPA: hypothetical protein VNX21_05530 [Candidatus Thermoplasmatota archaeon]|nr:hypothetical protein [Candidatus Thermoplasmatota archaeon]